jgi:ribosomal protein S18 acetylase RimI-like enzyme
MMQAIARAFRPDEWLVYKVLRLRSLEDAPSAFGSTLALELLRADTEWTERVRIAATSNSDCALFAEIEGVPSGLVWAKADGNDPHTINIFQMWVAPEARSRGLGSALLNAAIHWARQYGAHFAKLGVTCGDTPAVRLYKRAGFRDIGAKELIREGSEVLAQTMVLSLVDIAV